MSGQAVRGDLGPCSYCGKRAWSSRRTARAAARILHPGDSRLNAYPCPHRPAEFDQVWHLGHLPGPVVRGRIGRALVRTARRTP